jgi:hypothetical protein
MNSAGGLGSENEQFNTWTFSRAVACSPSRLGPHRIHWVNKMHQELPQPSFLFVSDSPFDNWIVDAAGSIPAKIPRYLTSECEIREMGLLYGSRGQYAAEQTES